jgi:hypothetical protein
MVELSEEGESEYIQYMRFLLLNTRLQSPKLAENSVLYISYERKAAPHPSLSFLLVWVQIRVHVASI